MKIYGLDDEIIVDSIPFDFNPNQKVFLTTLVHLEGQQLPQEFPKIYTSKILKQQFKTYLKRQGIEISEDNFHTWKPFEPEIITLTNGKIYEILPCCPTDITTNMSLIFRQDSTIKHIYLGLCSDIKSILANMTLLSWLVGIDSKPDIYIPASVAARCCVDCEFRKAIVEIENRVNAENTQSLLIQLPFFGSEAFIAKVSHEFRGHVALCGILKEFYMILPNAKMKNFAEDFNSSRIIITGADTFEFLSSKLEKDDVTHTKNLSIKWSPFPSPTEVNLLMDLVVPKRVYGIPIKNSHASVEQPVKIYCVHINNDQSMGQLVLEHITRQSYNKEQCCLENFQVLNKVVGNVKKILKQDLRAQELFNDKFKVKTEAADQQNLENTVISSPNCRKRAYPNDEIVKSPSNKKIIELDVNGKANLEQPIVTENMHQKTTRPNDNASSDEFCCIPSTSKQAQQHKSVQGTETQAASIHSNIAFYQKGKKGATFLDEDSLSSSD